MDGTQKRNYSTELTVTDSQVFDLREELFYKCVVKYQTIRGNQPSHNHLTKKFAL